MKKIAMLLIFCCTILHAQKENFDNLWFIYFGNQQVTKKLNWWTEAQFRNTEAAGNPQNILLRTGIGYNLSENNNNLLLGYGYIIGYAEDAEQQAIASSKEHRIYQQFIHKNKIGKVPLQHRFRLEERFLENEFKLRARYFLAANVPLGENFMKEKSTYLSLYNEIFVVPEERIFDRNRIYAALGYVLNKNTRIEVGYMDQTTFKKGTSPFSSKLNQGQIQLVIFNTINFN